METGDRAAVLRTPIGGAMRIGRVRTTCAILSAAVAVLVPARSHALFHIAVMDEVVSSWDGDADQQVRDAPDHRHRNEEEPSAPGHLAKLPLALRAPQADLPAVH